MSLVKFYCSFLQTMKPQNENSDSELTTGMLSGVGAAFISTITAVIFTTICKRKQRQRRKKENLYHSSELGSAIYINKIK